MTISCATRRLFFARDLFKKFGLYNENFKFAADFDFLFRAWHSKRVRFKHIDEVIAVYDTAGVSGQEQNGPKVMKEYAKIQRSTLPVITYWKKNGIHQLKHLKILNENLPLRILKSLIRPNLLLLYRSTRRTL